MIYKTETKENFDIIIPQMSQFNYIMAEALVAHCEHLQKNDKSAIIDFSNVVSAEEDALRLIEKLHSTFYGQDLSLAICQLTPEIRVMFKAELNIVPTQIEAIDLISMEGLERELLGGE